MSAVTLVPAGVAPTKFDPGDFFLVHETRFVSKMIQLGQRRRFTKEEAYWNHCGVIITEEGSIAEALVRTGVTVSNLLKYKDVDYFVVNIDANDTDRKQILEFTEWTIGKRYDMFTDVSLALWCLFGGKFDFSLESRFICSGLVAKATERAGYIYERDSARTMPADLAAKFNVHASEALR